MMFPVGNYRPQISGRRRVGAWLLKGAACAVYFPLWFSYSGYGLLIDGALVAAFALLYWLAWIVEGRP